MSLLPLNPLTEANSRPYPPGCQEVDFPPEPPELSSENSQLKMVISNPWEEQLAPVVDGFICQALRELGAFRLKGEAHSSASLILRYGVLPVYRSLLQEWLDRLAELKLLARKGPFFSNPEPLPDLQPELILAEFKDRLPQYTPVFEFIERSGKSLAEVVRGNINPVQLLFPDGSFETAEAIYKDLPFTLYFNQLMRWAFDNLLQDAPAEQPLVILEIGAGSGSTTEVLLPILAEHKVEYCYTDLSNIFLRRGKQKFEKYPFVRFEQLDISRPVEEQGFEPVSYDFIVATNVMHVTPDVKEALRQVRRLLKPGGWFLLNETTLRLVWLDMTMALFPEWQVASHDPARSGHPFVKAARWTELLAEAGFNRLKILPDFDAGPEQLRQHLLLASYD
ncbi:MAG TPA: class I SAM-dependent methyltransferase [Chloroflexia bacterium]|nr:class I SAM-dependent methyltransferase [Chloroflexia bacterium]